MTILFTHLTPQRQPLAPPSSIRNFDLLRWPLAHIYKQYRRVSRLPRPRTQRIYYRLPYGNEINHPADLHSAGLCFA